MCCLVFDRNVRLFLDKQLEDFTIYVDMDATDPTQGSERRSRCFHYPGKVVPVATVHLDCCQPIYGHYVIVMKPFGTPLVLCEVEVIANPAMGGKYRTYINS